MKPATVVNETSVDWDATQDEHMGLPRKTTRKSSSMDDQRLKSLVEESVQGMNDSILADIHSLLLEVVGSKTQCPERDSHDDRFPTAPNFRHKPPSVEFGRFRGENSRLRLFPVLQLWWAVGKVSRADVVLGVAWLATLGRVTTDYATREFEFTLCGSKWLWKRDPPTDAHQIQLHSLRRMTTTDAIASFFFLAMITPEGSCAGEMTTNLSGLLESYHDVFQKPTGLPPSRAQDHSIHLVPGAQPVNVKPYRYPHFQKQVMEQMVKDMLKDGVIQPSTSPFSSPVLLVCKKDGTWRFCVDYRALNAITIRDRFPIPTIDELFDELHGAKFFSKLDLLSGYHKIKLKLEDVAKTAFRTHDGHYEF
ncbi:uncharacterized protein [Solanum lycopersicum]|uniref:uncharacterized protein n=1 Tax=Solanum lycopersicum TaxID=4081 RepID=UPI0037486653